MAPYAMEVVVIKDDDRKFTNIAYCSPKDFSQIFGKTSINVTSRGCNLPFLSSFSSSSSKQYFAAIEKKFSPNKLVVSLREDENLDEGQLALNENHCEFVHISEGDRASIEVFVPPHDGFNFASLEIEVYLIQDGITPTNQIEASTLAKEFVKVFCKQVIIEYQTVILRYKDVLYHCTVFNGSHSKEMKDLKQGMIRNSTKVTVNIDEELCAHITGADVNKRLFRKGFDINYVEEELKAAGMSRKTSQFYNILLEAFVFRGVLSPLTAKRLNLKLPKGMLLHGPNGSGKTLTALSICKLLNAKEPVIVDGQELLNSNAPERMISLFDKVIVDDKRYGIKSDLHIFIFKNIDYIAKTRGPEQSCYETMYLYQLFTLFDRELDNIFIIATTSRKDIIDVALLRHGRIEVQMKIDYPDEEGRAEMLETVTRKIRQGPLLDLDVDIREIARRKDGCGASSLESVVREALVKEAKSKVLYKERKKERK